MPRGRKDATVVQETETPDYTEVMPVYTDEDTAAQARAYRTADAAVEGLQAAIKSKRVTSELEEDMRVFVAPIEPNTSFLVKPGKLIHFPDPNSPSGQRDARRDGDVWAEFHSGICATQDEDVIEWCMSHSGDRERHKEWHAAKHEDGTAREKARECPVDPGFCRDIDWPGTAAWAEMKTLQHPTARRSAFLPATMNLDELFARIPNAMGVGGGEVGTRLQRAATAAKTAERERTRGR